MFISTSEIFGREKKMLEWNEEKDYPCNSCEKAEEVYEHGKYCGIECKERNNCFEYVVWECHVYEKLKALERECVRMKEKKIDELLEPGSIREHDEKERWGLIASIGGVIDPHPIDWLAGKVLEQQDRIDALVMELVKARKTEMEE